MKNFFNNNRAFLLLELLLIVFITAALGTIVFSSVLRNRSGATDANRLADVKQIQYALDNFAENDGEYPEDREFIPGGSLSSRNGHLVFLEAVPHNQKKTGQCPDKDFQYHQTSDGRSYILTYCLGTSINGLSAGECIAMPGNPCVQNTTCSCSDINKSCCGYCNAGDTCGGGTFKKV